MLFHGFTQTRRSWGAFGQRLAGSREVVTLDAPGHGDAAGWHAGLWEGAAGMAELAGGGTYVGYSMGGRFALHAALSHPDLVRRLVLISTTAGIDDPAERAARRAADDALAARVEREGVAAFVAWWLAQPMWATLPPEAAGAEERAANTAAGLATSLRLAGTGTQDPLWNRLGEIRMPVLVVAGAADTKYAALARRLGAGLADAEVVVVPGAGHACHLERPDTVATVVAGWLDAHPAPPAH